MARLDLIPHILRWHDSLASYTPVLSSIPFMPGKARARTCRIYIKSKIDQKGRDAIAKFINNLPSKALEYPQVVSNVTDELYQEFSYEELCEGIIPRIAGRIENIRSLSESQKLYIYLMLGAHQHARRYLDNLPVLRKPDFIIAGAQKAGTTWLMDALSNHPDIWGTPTELHYFTSNRRRWTWEEYLALFSLSGSRLNGEKSVTYLQVIDEVVNKLPGTKVFVILRDPFDRIVSQYFHDIRNHRFRDRNGIKNIKDYIERNIGDCRERGLYYSNIRNSLSRINILFYQEISDNPVALLKIVLMALGLRDVDPTDLIPKRRINKSDNKPKISYKEFLKSAGLAQTLKEYYYDDISKLSQVTGKDLSSWMDW
ncbi:MAG TPA: sulfotransferase [Thermodesulfobacteriota bacterium]|nr:sulfotransferase [Thermodesulfobacteriota bacterium]